VSLAHAILGFLEKTPLTGYDLKTICFDGSVNYFWAADQAQIYRTLDKMQEQGLVESKLEYQENRPNRKVYHITESGRAELTRWLRASQPLPAKREPFLVQLYFSAEQPQEEVIGLLQQQMALHRELLAQYVQVPLPHFDNPDINREEMFARFTLDFGLRLEKTYIEWLEACIKRLHESSLKE
jgi:PadR family transcriptional regulator, regulatory protein AphA